MFKHSVFAATSILVTAALCSDLEDLFLVTTPVPSPEIGTEISVPVPQTWVTIMCRPSDVFEEPKGTEYFNRWYSAGYEGYPSIPHYFREVTRGAVDVNPYSYAVGWYELPRPRSDYTVAFALLYELLVRDCVSQAEVDFDFSQVWGINIVLNFEHGYAIGSQWNGTLDGVNRSWPVTLLPTLCWENLACVVHEMLHTEGLEHSRGGANVTENPWDVMSNIEGGEVKIGSFCHLATDPVLGCLPQAPISYHLFDKGWLDQEDVVIVHDGIRQLRLFSLLPAEGGGPRMVIIPAGQCDYTVEARTSFTYDSRLPLEVYGVNGAVVIIHQVCAGREEAAWVVDATPDDGDAGDPGAMWEPGEVFADQDNQVYVCVGERHGTNTIDVTVSRGVEPQPCS